MTELFEVGKIVKPHGLKGYLKIYMLTTQKDRFAIDETEYIIAGASFKIEDVKKLGKNIIVKFFDIDDRNRAEAFREEIIYVKHDDLVSLNPGEYYAHDILDCEVRDINGMFMGTVTDIYFTHDTVLDLERKDGSTITLLFKHEFIQSVDIENKVIIMKNESSYYEY